MAAKAHQSDLRQSRAVLERGRIGCAAGCTARPRHRTSRQAVSRGHRAQVSDFSQLKPWCRRLLRPASVPMLNLRSYPSTPPPKRPRVTRAGGQARWCTVRVQPWNYANGIGHLLTDARIEPPGCSRQPPLATLAIAAQVPTSYLSRRQVDI